MDELFSIKNAIFLLVFVVIYLVSSKFTEKVVRRHNNLATSFFANALKVFIVLTGLISFLWQYDAFKGVINTLLTNSAILVAVVGFTLQNSIKNIIAGLLLLSADTFKVGDRVRIPSEGISGEIEELTLRHAKIKLATSERAIVPNYLLNDTVVINNNLHNEETCYPLVVPVSIDANIELAKDIVEAFIAAHEDIIKKELSQTIVTTLSVASVEIRTMVWTRDMKTSFRVLSELRMSIIQEFQKQGIYSK